jgi:hypothetical protein
MYQNAILKGMLLLILYLNSITGNSQGYTSLQKNDVYLFEPTLEMQIRELPSAKYIHGVRTDSVYIVGNDTILIFQSEMTCLDNLNPDECIWGYSWLGNKLIKRSSGDELFFNYDGDTLLIQTHAELNDSWRFWTADDSSYIEAKLVSIRKESFLEETDTVKTISLAHFNKEGTLFQHIQYDSIKLSKNYGLLTCYNFRDFPSNDRNMPVVSFKLIGTTRKQTGFQLFTKADVYDFEIGDEFHVDREYEYWLYWTGRLHLREIHKIIDKWNSPIEDTLYFRVKMVSWEKDSSEIEVDTSILIIPDPDKALDLNQYNDIVSSKEILPFELTDFETSMATYVLFSENKFNNRCQIFSPREFYELIDHERFMYLGETWDSHVYRKNHFIEGCGLYENIFGNEGGGAYSIDFNELVYFKKGNEEWGNPLIPTSIKNNIYTTLKCYPNPAKDVIRIDLQLQENERSNLDYVIVGITGKKWQSGVLNYRNMEINIMKIPSGIYWVLLKGNNHYQCKIIRL